MNRGTPAISPISRWTTLTRWKSCAAPKARFMEPTRSQASFRFSRTAAPRALRSARGAAVRENLNDACDRVGSIKRAFGAAHDFHLVNVVHREIGEIAGVPRFIHGSSVDEHPSAA